MPDLMVAGLNRVGGCAKLKSSGNQLRPQPDHDDQMAMAKFLESAYPGDIAGEKLAPHWLVLAQPCDDSGVAGTRPAHNPGIPLDGKADFDSDQIINN